MAGSDRLVPLGKRAAPVRAVVAGDGARKVYVETYGCQMNEYDSERVAGLLRDERWELTADERAADLIILNTCAIRENADNKLYGHLGQLKTWKQERAGRQIVVAGCLAQKDRDVVRSRAGHVDVVLGTHNVHRAAALLAESRRAGRVP